LLNNKRERLREREREKNKEIAKTYERKTIEIIELPDL